MWVYRSNEYTAKPVVIYDYQPSRARRCPKAFLMGFSGYLQCDGYSAYEKIDDIIPVGCWAHARRKFHDALTAQPKSKIGVVISYTLNQWES
ncbi:MAG: transposase [Moritella sp.]|nr:transposase [Moritella sp.]